MVLSFGVLADTNQVDDTLTNTTATILPGMVTVKSGHSGTRTHLHNKLIQKDQSKKTQRYKVESLSGGANIDIHNFSLENKRETEYVSHTQSLLVQTWISSVLERRICVLWMKVLSERTWYSRWLKSGLIQSARTGPRTTHHGK